MDIESIKKVKLLVSLKGTEGGKQILWLAGTVFDKDIKPFPPSISAELQLKRIGVLEVLEVYPKEVKEPVTTDTVKIDAEEMPAPPIVEPAEEKSEVPKDDSPILTTRRRRR